MVFNLKAASIIGAVTLASIISPAFHSLRRHCYPMTSNVLLTKALSVAEPILKCRSDSGDKDYSVFLVLKAGSNSSNQMTPYFKVVDNNDHQAIKWEGPNNSGTNIWDDWALQVLQDKNKKNQGYPEEVSIRVPKNGKTFKKSYDGISISCQTSELKLKKDTREAQCSGGFLKAKNMKLSLQASNIIISSANKASQFDWKDDFKQKPVFCTS